MGQGGRENPKEAGWGTGASTCTLTRGHDQSIITGGRFGLTRRSYKPKAFWGQEALRLLGQGHQLVFMCSFMKGASVQVTEQGRRRQQVELPLKATWQARTHISTLTFCHFFLSQIQLQKTEESPWPVTPNLAKKVPASNTQGKPKIFHYFIQELLMSALLTWAYF